MARSRVVSKGVNRVQNSLRRVVSGTPEIVDSDVREWSQNTRKVLKGTKAPPKRPNQTYVRTGVTASSFRVRKVALASYAIENSQDHATYVIGDEKGENQAWMHEGRWWTMREVIEEQIPKLTKALTTKIKRFLNGND